MQPPPERQPAGRRTGGQFAARALGEGPPITSTYPEEGSEEWAYGEVCHWASPVIGWIRRAAHAGNPDALAANEQHLQDRLRSAAESIRPDMAEETAELLLARILPLAEECAADPLRDPEEGLKAVFRAAAADAQAL